MNILIIGMQATGKSVVAQALKEYHEARSEDVVVYDDTVYTDSYTVGEARQKTAEARIKGTKGKPNAHTICVMQSGTPITISPNLVDYMIQTSKMR